MLPEKEEKRIKRTNIKRCYLYSLDIVSHFVTLVRHTVKELETGDPRPRRRTEGGAGDGSRRLLVSSYRDSSPGAVEDVTSSETHVA